MTGFRVGVFDPILAAWPSAEIFTRGNYFNALATRADSVWYLTTSMDCFRGRCGSRIMPARRSSSQSSTQVWSRGSCSGTSRPVTGSVGWVLASPSPTAAGATRPLPHRPPPPSISLPAVARSSASAQANAKATSHTESIGPSQWRGLRRRWPLSAHCGFEWRTRQPGFGVFPLRDEIDRRRIGKSGRNSGLQHTVRHAACRRSLRRWLLPAFPHRPKDYAQRLKPYGQPLPTRVATHGDHSGASDLLRNRSEPRRRR